MREDVMWTWDYELRTLGSWPSERYNGHNMPVEVVTKADHDAALRRAKAEGLMEGMRQTKWGIELVKDEQVRDALLRWVDAKIDVIEAKLKADELDARAAQIEEGSK